MISFVKKINKSLFTVENSNRFFSRKIYQDIITFLFIVRREILSFLRIGDITWLEKSIAFGAKTNLSLLSAKGIDTVLDLNDEGEEKRTSLRLGLGYFGNYIRDDGVPSLQQLEKILFWINKQIASGHTVFIHCNLGRGRSPLIVVSYLIKKGYTLNKAIRYVKKIRPIVRFTRCQLKLLKDYESKKVLKKATEDSRELGRDISVIIPVTSGIFLDETLKSIEKQKFDGSIRIILILMDLSRDRTLIVKQMLSNIKHKITIFNKSSSNRCVGFNEGIKYSQSPYILLIHDDCALLGRDWISKAIETLQNHKDVAGIVSRVLFPLQELSLREKIYLMSQKLGALDRHIFGVEQVGFAEHKCDLFRKDFLEAIGGFLEETGIAADQAFSYTIRSVGGKILRRNDLQFIERFGSCEGTLCGMFRKLFQYGRKQGAILFKFKKSVFSYNMTSLGLNRIVNRFFTIIFPLSLLGLNVWLFIDGLNLTTGFLFLSILIVRFLYLTLRAWKLHILQKRDIFCLPFVPICDIVYAIGLLYGIAWAAFHMVSLPSGE